MFFRSGFAAVMSFRRIWQTRENLGNFPAREKGNYLKKKKTEQRSSPRFAAISTLFIEIYEKKKNFKSRKPVGKYYTIVNQATDDVCPEAYEQ